MAVSSHEISAVAVSLYPEAKRPQQRLQQAAAATNDDDDHLKSTYFTENSDKREPAASATR
jgi:hypothetical protein